MSRSKHTDPRAVRAARRVAAPRAGRGEGDLSARRQAGRHRELAGAAGTEAGEAAGAAGERAPRAAPLPRIIVRRPRPGFHHPAGKRDVEAVLRALGPVACYGLRSVELGRGAAPDPGKALVFGRYHAPGRIVLYEQPLPPWRLPAAARGAAARRLQRAGAVLTPLAGGAALVEWPRDTLRIFMLAEVLLHELGHHVLQRDKGKRLARIARTRDHEAFARRFGRRLWTALGAAGVLQTLGAAGGGGV